MDIGAALWESEIIKISEGSTAALFVVNMNNRDTKDTQKSPTTSRILIAQQNNNTFKEESKIFSEKKMNQTSKDARNRLLRLDQVTLKVNDPIGKSHQDVSWLQNFKQNNFPKGKKCTVHELHDLTLTAQREWSQQRINNKSIIKSSDISQGKPLPCSL